MKFILRDNGTYSTQDDYEQIIPCRVSKQRLECNFDSGCLQLPSEYSALVFGQVAERVMILVPDSDSLST